MSQQTHTKAPSRPLRSLSSPRAAFVGTLFALALSGCTGGGGGGGGGDSTGCDVDADCPNFHICEVETGFCLCAADDACDAAEFCNPQGRCQAKPGCESNADCRSDDRPNDICDTTVGECVTLNASSLQCTLDSHCPFGSECRSNLCVAGCTLDGDCPLGQPCIDGTCDPTPGACTSNAFCEIGELCNVTTQRCQDHREADYLCDWCGPTDIGACGGGQALGGGSCLFDNSVPTLPCTNDADCTGEYPGSRCAQPQCMTDADCSGGTCVGAFFGLPGQCQGGQGQCQRAFCGSSDCSDSDPCPRGYQCYRLIEATGQPCTVGDNTCTDGRACSAGGENSVTGFCSCISDSDCSPGSTCSNPGPDGICLIGATCGPASGLTCETLR